MLVIWLLVAGADWGGSRTFAGAFLCTLARTCFMDSCLTGSYSTWLKSYSYLN